jgi:hypothetical protein
MGWKSDGDYTSCEMCNDVVYEYSHDDCNICPECNNCYCYECMTTYEMFLDNDKVCRHCRDTQFYRNLEDAQKKVDFDEPYTLEYNCEARVSEFFICFDSVKCRTISQRDLYSIDGTKLKSELEMALNNYRNMNVDTKHVELNNKIDELTQQKLSLLNELQQIEQSIETLTKKLSNI